jgi:hypothetical protein
MTNALNNVIPTEFRFLQEKCGFRVTWRGDRAVELRDGNLRVIFSQDRDPSAPITILVASVYDQQGPGNWIVDFGLHEVMWLASAIEPGKYPSDVEMADFLRANMPKVQSMFSSSNITATKAARDKLTVELLKKQAPDKFIDLTDANPSDGK